MEILIADDQSEKHRTIEEFLNESFQSCSIDHSYSFKSTRDKIISKKYDIILLDMTMPSFDSKQNVEIMSEVKKRALAGRDIVQTMNYRCINSHVIIVTQFDVFGRHNQLTSIEEIATDLIHTYPNLVKGYILWDYQGDSWKDSLKKLIEDSEID
jgi:CheY-like chemotaxis protein